MSHIFNNYLWYKKIQKRKGKAAEIKIPSRPLEYNVNKKNFQNWSHRPGTKDIIIMDRK